MDFKYKIEELEAMIVKIDKKKEYDLTTIDMQNVMLHLSKNFHLFHPKRELNKDNLRLYGLKTINRTPHLIKEYLFVSQTEKIIEKLNSNNFIDKNEFISHNYYEPKSKIMISFYTKYNSMICKIIKDLRTNKYNLLLVLKKSETGEILNKRYSLEFDTFEGICEKLIEISEQGELDFFDDFEYLSNNSREIVK